MQLDFTNADFPVSLVDVDEPRLVGPGWARVEVSGGGICGSDLHIFTSATGPSPTLTSIIKASSPPILGHEISGRVVQAGPECPVPVGRRVTVAPAITCEARGIEPPCPPCSRGQQSSCQNLDRGIVTSGIALGGTAGLGGGWAEQVVAHHSQLFAVPDTVPERAACLCEPVSVAIHGLLRQPPLDGDPVLVIGAGTIGLAAVAALRALWPSCPVTVVARHDHQAVAARACGAQHVVRSSPDADHYAALAELSSARVTGSRDEAMLAGGFPFVVEAVGAADSVTEALRVVDNRGIVLLLGVAGISTVDLTPVWWKEAGLVGAVNHAWDPGPREGPTDHSMVRALELLTGGLPPHEVIITHEFPLESYRDALEIAIDRRSGSIKVVLRPQW